MRDTPSNTTGKIAFYETGAACDQYFHQAAPGGLYCFILLLIGYIALGVPVYLHFCRRYVSQLGHQGVLHLIGEHVV